VEASHADDRGEGFRAFKTRMLAASLGHEPSLKARNFSLGVRLNLLDPHVVNDRTVGWEVSKFPRAIVHEGVILVLHGSLPVRGLGAGEGDTVRGRFDAVPRRHEGNVRQRRTRRGMRGLVMSVAMSGCATISVVGWPSSWSQHVATNTRGWSDI
jgi:hypothetical protein